MLKLKSAYEFYDMEEPQRLALVGSCFQEEDMVGPRGRKGPSVPRPGIYFPIELTEEGSWSNYNRKQGLLYTTGLLPKKDGKTWARVAAFSPDDLDMDLDWDPCDAPQWERIMDVVRQMPKDNVTYQECLDFIQSFCGGERTS